jgi:hypothetical protein
MGTHGTEYERVERDAYPTPVTGEMVRRNCCLANDLRNDLIFEEACFELIVNVNLELIRETRGVSEVAA